MFYGILSMYNHVKGGVIVSGTYRGYTDAQKRATAKYKEANYKRVPLDMPVSEYEAMKQHCIDHGEKVNGFIRRLVRDEIARAAGVPGSEAYPE